MPMKRETGKDRWKRVPKDYFRTRDRLQGAKLRLSGLACVLALGWAALGVDWGSGNPLTATDLNSLRANHGTLARVHSAWDRKCDACHVPFEPIDGRPLFASKSSPSSRSSDRLCMSCHAGPAHHASMIESEVKACAECHRDHQGRDFPMARLADNECTSCHGSLGGHVDAAKKPAGSRIYGNVARFNAQDHPPFRPEAAALVDGTLRDRSRLKFNHALHMTRGLVREPGQTAYTVDKIPLAPARARYQGAGTANGPVQLECASCHQLDSAEAQATPDPAVARAALPSRGAGRYYLPITFENQCRACHSLTFDPRMKDLEAPHGVQPDQVVGFLERTYAAQVLADDPKLLDVFVPPVRLPGKAPASPTARKLRDEAVAKATTFLFPADVQAPAGQDRNKGNCLECHHYGKEKLANEVPAAVEATRVPEVWFTHASFDHSSHRAVSCRECHAASYPLREDGRAPNPGASRSATDVLIPAIDNCARCHAPAQGAGGWLASAPRTSGGGASFDCTECHRYHDGDRASEGRGARARDAVVDRTIAEFLQGVDLKPAPRAKSPGP